VVTSASDAAAQAHFDRWCSQPSAIQPHLPRLRDLSIGCDLAVEFGVKRAASSAALLLGADRVISYDIVVNREAQAFQAKVGDRWTYCIQDSRTAPVIPCDLLFVDSLHTYAQTKAELDRHAHAVRRWLVFHDTVTFGSVGANGETGQQAWAYTPGVSVPPMYLGIRPAIDELMVKDWSWRIVAHYTDSHGLLVLERHL